MKKKKAQILCAQRHTHIIRANYAQIFLLKLFYFLVLTCLHTSFPLTTPPLSQSASVHKLKVDFICPIVSALSSHLPRLCHTVLCGSDNGSNYICSMSVLQHSSSSTGRLWHHDAQSRVTSSPALENQIWAWISSSETQTTMVYVFIFAHRVHQICRQVKESPWIFFVLQFSLPVLSASISLSLNMLCSFSGICWNLVL